MVLTCHLNAPCKSDRSHERKEYAGTWVYLLKAHQTERQQSHADRLG